MNPSNQPPIAAAGDNQTVIVGETVQLDGSGSSDPDGPALCATCYNWVLVPPLPAGSTAVIIDSSSETPTFEADVAGDYFVELIVNDGTDDSAPDQVTIKALSKKIIKKLAIEIIEPADKTGFAITPEPQMPTINARARIVGVVPDPTSTTEFEWTFEIIFPKQIQQLSGGPVKVIGGSFTPDFTGRLQGGELKLKVVANVHGQHLEAETKMLRILGTNPTRNEIQALLAQGEIPSRAITLQQLACQESGQTQFDSKGQPLFGKPDGWGVMQLDPPPSDAALWNSDAALWNWKENVQLAKAFFDSKEEFAIAYPRVVRQLSQFQEAVTRLNEVRGLLGKPSITVVVPEFTADQVERDTLRLYNGIAGTDQWGRPDKLHEYELEFEEVRLPDKTKVQVLSVDDNNGEAKWILVEQGTREKREHTDPRNRDFVNSVLSHDPITCLKNKSKK